MPEKKYPRVGIGVMIQNDKDEVLLGLRQGSHGSGEWSFPGGHLELGETLIEAAKREVKEETGIEVEKLEIVSLSDEMRYLKSDGKQYFVIGLRAINYTGVPEVVEAEKWKEWQWFSLDNLPSPMLEATELMLNNIKAGRLY